MSRQLTVHGAFKLAVALLLLFGPAISGQASFDGDIKALLEQGEKPEGVVFEVVTKDRRALESLMPRIGAAIKQLRHTWPRLDVVVVAHGDEQFALTRDNAKKYTQLHKQIQTLVKDADVNLHVCGAYAEMHDVAPEAFPDYVNVSASGPAQINDYRTLGYEVILVKPE